MEHGNLVGKVVYKDIYIIRNTVNQKVYIGQAADVYIRWKGHKTAAKTGHYKSRSLLYEAMRNIGIDKFYYEIIESHVSNYNEREKYWIKFYNSLAPNGYNLLEGGEQYPNLSGVKNAGSAIKDVETLNLIISDLKYSDLTLVDISKKYGVPLNTIHGVNQGRTYHNAEFDYPIRKEKIVVKLTKKDVENLIIDLLDNKLTIKEIGDKYNVSDVTVNCINTGKTHRDVLANLSRPIRDSVVRKPRTLTEEEINEIIYLLTNTSLSLRAIGRKFNTEHSTIINIKNGTKTYRRQGVKYPLRPNN